MIILIIIEKIRQILNKKILNLLNELFDNDMFNMKI